MMYNENLESDLRQFARTKNEELFNTRLYEPLCQLFKWICSMQAKHLSHYDFEDTQQQVMVTVIKELKRYRSRKKMSAVSFVRMVMQHELVRCKKTIEKRHSNTVDYEVEKDYRTTPTDEKTIEACTSRLAEYKQAASPDEQKVIAAIITALNTPYFKTLNRRRKLLFIVNKSGTTEGMVRKVMEEVI